MNNNLIKIEEELLFLFNGREKFIHLKFNKLRDNCLSEDLYWEESKFLQEPIILYIENNKNNIKNDFEDPFWKRIFEYLKR